MQFLTNTNFDFVGKRKAAAVLSVLVILAGFVSLAMHGGPNLSIDFRGGQIIEVGGRKRRRSDRTAVDELTLMETGTVGERIVAAVAGRVALDVAVGLGGVEGPVQER